MSADTRTDEQKARSKRAHANSMIAMGAVTTACALAAGLIALGGGDMPDFMYGRWGGRAAQERPALRTPRPTLVPFEPWGDAPFARAAAEKKLVLLHLTTAWSRHGRWMEENVYGDPVCAEKAKALVPVKADLEANPELAGYHRGYPTTAVLLPDRRLVIAGTGMTCPMFAAFVDVVVKGGLEKAQAAASAKGRAPVVVPGAAAGGPFFPDWANMTPQRLPKALKLEDPVWGGFYRHAGDADGEQPEYERLLADQADALKALSHARPQEARRTLAFVERFLALKGGGYAGSLDSEVTLADGRVMDGRAYFALDDAGRRALGLPRADPRLFPEPNRRMAEAVLAAPQAGAAQKAHARRTLELLKRME